MGSNELHVDVLHPVIVRQAYARRILAQLWMPCWRRLGVIRHLDLQKREQRAADKSNCETEQNKEFSLENSANGMENFNFVQFKNNFIVFNVARNISGLQPPHWFQVVQCLDRMISSLPPWRLQ